MPDQTSPIAGQRTGESGSGPPVGSEELLQLLVESVTDYAIFVLDPQGHVASWNSGAEHIKGYTASEIIGRHFSVFYPKEDVAAGKPARELEVATRDGRVEDEGWRVRKDGSRFWANVIITALRDASGRLVGFAKVTRDLTMRRRAEEQARHLAAEQAARTATQELNHELTSLNEQLQDQASELEAQTEEAQSLTEELEQSNDDLQRTTADAEAARNAAQDAERRTRFLVNVGDVLSTSLDYDDRLQDLAQLVVPELGDWCTVDISEADGTSRQVAVVHNDPAKIEWARELGERYPPDPNAKTGVPQVLRTGQPELYANITDDLIAASAVDAKHLELLRQLHLRSALVVPLIARGRTLGALTLIAAESERRYTPEDLTFAMELARRAALAVDNARLHSETVKALKAAEEANRAKSQFLAVMSHELRTPLNAIAGYADLLRTGVRGPVNEEQAHDLDRILHSERALLSLINDILNFARLEAGRVEVRSQRMQVRELLESVEALVHPQLQEKSLRFTYDKPDPGLVACGDMDKARQVILNLLGNAIKFTPADGSITISASANGARVRITVEDTGAGIPADKLSTIFEPFVQVDRTLTSETSGSGLGLSISRDLARLMNGDLTVESTVGKGSRFTLTLPRDVAASGTATGA